MAIKTAEINYTVLPGVSYVISYKKASDSTWIIPPNNPTNVSPFLIAGLETEVLYDLKIQNNCGVASTQFTLTGVQTTIWIENTFTCEQSEPFNLDATYTGFSSPYGMMWDAPKQRFYVVDADAAGGHFWWFNPDTITGLASANYLTDTSYSDINVWAFDKQNRRIYAAGDQSSGMKVVDIANDTVTTLAYGTNVSPGSAVRAPIGLSPTTIYAFVKNAGVIRLYDRATLAFQSQITISSIPSASTYLTQGFSCMFVGSEIWVTAASRPNGNVARYNSDFTALNGTITLPGIATAFNGNFWQGTLYDSDNNRVFIGDDGSKKVFVIDTATASIINTLSLANFRGKAYANFSLSKSELDGNIYLQGSGINSLADGSPNFKLYKIDPISGNVITMYPDQQAGVLVNRTGTNEQWGCQPGLTSWQGGSWSTDGLILKYT